MRGRGFRIALTFCQGGMFAQLPRRAFEWGRYRRRPVARPLLMDVPSRERPAFAGMTMVVQTTRGEKGCRTSLTFCQGGSGYPANGWEEILGSLGNRVLTCNLVVAYCGRVVCLYG